MAYAVGINRKIRNTRTYVVLQSVTQKTNKFSLIMQGLVTRIFMRKQSAPSAPPLKKADVG